MSTRTYLVAFQEVIEQTRSIDVTDDQLAAWRADWMSDSLLSDGTIPSDEDLIVQFAPYYDEEESDSIDYEVTEREVVNITLEEGPALVGTLGCYTISRHLPHEWDHNGPTWCPGA